MILQRLTAPLVACALVTSVMIAPMVHAADELAATRGLAEAGATRLALQRVDVLQPAAVSAPLPKGNPSGAGWIEWERLRLQLLLSIGSHEILLQRVAAMPAGVDAAVAAEFHATAARTALAIGRGAAARVAVAP